MIPTVIAVLVTVTLVAIVIYEAKTGKIANILIGAMLLLFVLKMSLHPEPPNLAWQLGSAVGVLIAGYALFLAGAFAAGAAKLSAAVTLFIPLDQLDVLGIILVAAVIGSLIFFGTVRAFFGHERSDWFALANRVVPMSFPIGITTVCGLILV